MSLLNWISSRGTDLQPTPRKALRCEVLENRVLFSAVACAPIPLEAALESLPSSSEQIAAYCDPAQANSEVSAFDNNVGAQVSSTDSSLSPISLAENSSVDRLSDSSNDFVPKLNLEQLSPPSTSAVVGDMNAPTRSFEFVIIDGELEDIPSLITYFEELRESGRSIAWKVLESGVNLAEQVDHLVEDGQPIDTLHILSHGSPRGIKLAGDWFDFEQIQNNSSLFHHIGLQLQGRGEILLYGCNLAGTAEGIHLLQLLADVTGREVAASTNDTGSANLGGDWTLEYFLGDSFDSELRGLSPAPTTWLNLLNTFVVTNTNDSGAGSLRQAILDANALNGADTITFSLNSADGGYVDPTPGNPSSGDEYWSINLNSALPSITEELLIDGTSQTGYTSHPLVELNGTNAGVSADGFTISADDVTIRGLAINRFSGDGIYIGSGQVNTIVQANIIGLDVTGVSNLGNGGNGILVDGNSSLIGGTVATQGNKIAYNGLNGIRVASGTGNTILRNSIVSNTSLGIDIGAGGVSANDTLDVDGAGNNTQNFPVIGSALFIGSDLRIRGTLSSEASTNYRIDFYSSSVADSSGFGEGQKYIGATTVTTDGNGNSTFEVTLTGTTALVGETISATATVDLGGGSFADTSEFSSAVTATAHANTPPSFSSGDGVVLTNLNSMGELAYAMTVQSDGKFIVVGEHNNGAQFDVIVARFLASGQLDTSFDANGIVSIDIAGTDETGYGVTVQSDGKIIVVGSHDNGSNNDLLVARLNTDGSLDNSFGAGGLVTTSVGGGSDIAYGVSVQSDGKIVVVGTYYSGTSDAIVAVRYLSDGTIDAGFGASGLATFDLSAGEDRANAVAIQSNDRIVIAGHTNNGTDSDIAALRLLTDGSLDNSFGNAGVVSVDVAAGFDSALALNLLSNGDVLLGGYGQVASVSDYAMVKLNSDGSLDSGFNGSGIQTTDIGGSTDRIHSIAVQNDSRIVVGGTSWDGAAFQYSIARYFADGSLDSSFDGDGIVTSSLGGIDDEIVGISVDNDGNIYAAGFVAAGLEWDTAISKYSAEGVLDTQFDASPSLGGVLSYYQGQAPMVLDSNVQIYDGELFQSGNFAGATLTLARAGGANANDLFSATSYLNPLTEGGALIYTGVTIGTVTTNSNGTLLLTFNSNATASRVSEAMQLIAYSNTAGLGGALFDIEWTFSDGNAGAQGTGGALTTTGTVTIANANTVIVDSIQDTVDGDTSSIAALNANAGVDGLITLREAILATNNSANVGTADQIHFNISGSGPHTINLTSALPTITDAVIIDGWTEPNYASSPVIELNGTNAGSGVSGLTISASNSTVRGLVINRFNGSGIVVSGDTNTITGNVIGLNNSGTTTQANGGDGIRISGSSNTVGGTTAASRNTISGNANYGIHLQGSLATANTVLGNYIGLDSTGANDRGNTLGGIYLSNDAAGNLIGTSVTGGANFISGNDGAGILISNSNLNQIKNNRIGLNAAQTLTIGNSGHGIELLGTSSENLLGGPGTSEGNIITGSGGDGISLPSSSAQLNVFLRNSIYGNSGLGIDLENDGVTLNDSGDGDSGANDLTNFPVLTLAKTNGSNQLTVSGNFSGNSNSYYRVAFYSNSSYDTSLYGEGATFLGSVNISTNGSGAATFSTTISANVAVGTFITSTATETDSSHAIYYQTSEFAKAIAAISSTQASITVDSITDVSDGDTTSLSTLLVDRGADGVISLREAIIAANQTANGTTGVDRIRFSITGSGPHTISVSSQLPSISDGVLIDGWSEPDYVSTPVITLDGTSAAGTVDGLELTSTADGSTIRGLRIQNFSGYGIDVLANSNSNTIVGNIVGGDSVATIGMGNGLSGIRVQGANNTIGGTTSQNRNIISDNGQIGVLIRGSSATGNLVAGNYIGVDSTGNLDIGNTGTGIEISNGANNNTIGGNNSNARNIISGNNGEGIAIFDSGTTDNVVAGNYIGLGADGSTALGNTFDGIHVASGASRNQIGGDDSSYRNIISSNGAKGFQFEGTNTSGNLARANWIGLDATGTLARGNYIGVSIQNGATNNMIGGPNQAMGNFIGYNTGDGIEVIHSNTTGNTFLSNTFYNNFGLPIDLNNDDVSANDQDDVDTGPNNMQNYPVLSQVVFSDGDTTITGSLNSAPNTTYRLDFYSAPSSSFVGLVEPDTYHGYSTVTTDASGNSNFTIVLSGVTIVSGRFVSATATVNPGGVTLSSTSEFSPTVMAPLQGVTVSSLTASVSETGTTATFSIVLDTQPTADVTLSLSSSAVDEGTIDTTSMTFTPSNWNTPQVVTITGIDDFIDDGNVNFTVITSATSSLDSSYNLLTVDNVSVTNVDNDTAGLIVSSISGHTTELGGTATFTVALSAEPTHAVTVSLQSSDTTEGTISVSSLNFDNTNWTVPQQITVTGVRDWVEDGNVSYQVIFSDIASTDTAFDTASHSAVSVVNDNVTNQLPQASSDWYATWNNVPLVVSGTGVLSNDFDAEGDALTVSLVNSPNRGSVVLYSSGSFIFYPDVNYIGTVTFSYLASDPGGDSGIVTVTIEIVPGIGYGGGGGLPNPGTPTTPPTGSPLGPLTGITPVSIEADETGNQVPRLEPQRESSQLNLQLPTGDSSFANAETEGHQSTIQQNDRQERRSSSTEIQNEDLAKRPIQEEARKPNELSIADRSSALLSNLMRVERSLQALKSQNPIQDGAMQIEIGSASVVVTSASIGYVLFTLRATYVASLFATAVPTWSRFDPLSILDKSGVLAGAGGNSESLQEILDKQKAAAGKQA